jgi:uncharacterized membrane protein (DUF2068 family)
MPSATRSKNESERGEKTIFIIALLKFLKGFLLLILSVGLLSFLHKDVSAILTHWAEQSQLDTNRYVSKFLTNLGVVSDTKITLLSVASFAYAALFLTEGIGLFLHKHWAEWMTLIVTASFIPLEIHEFIRNSNAIRGVIIFLNAAIVVYLGVRLRQRGKHRH